MTSRLDTSSRQLVDAIVLAIDTDRAVEVEQLRAALAFIGLEEAFRDELRLNGQPSETTCECCQEVWR